MGSLALNGDECIQPSGVAVELPVAQKPPPTHSRSAEDHKARIENGAGQTVVAGGSGTCPPALYRYNQRCQRNESQQTQFRQHAQADYQSQQHTLPRQLRFYTGWVVIRNSCHHQKRPATDERGHGVVVDGRADEEEHRIEGRESTRP